MKNKKPWLRAVKILGLSWVAFIALAIAGNFVVAWIYRTRPRFNWSFAFVLILMTPIVLLPGILASVRAFAAEREKQSAAKTKDQDDIRSSS
jgi:hypothetical protein